MTLVDMLPAEWNDKRCTWFFAEPNINKKKKKKKKKKLQQAGKPAAPRPVDLCCRSIPEGGYDKHKINFLRG